jgi:hypothetical protein
MAADPGILVEVMFELVYQFGAVPIECSVAGYAGRCILGCRGGNRKSCNNHGAAEDAHQTAPPVNRIVQARKSSHRRKGTATMIRRLIELLPDLSTTGRMMKRTARKVTRPTVRPGLEVIRKRTATGFKSQRIPLSAPGPASGSAM